MSTLITVIGNCGSGKTALTRKLCEHYGLEPLLEQHAERPFQAQFQSDLKAYSLPNQIDYLLFRAEQERILRDAGQNGIADGGLDQDFYVFTQLFHRKGLLDDREHALCERLYRALRQALPPPELVLRLTVPLGALMKRRAARTRALDIVTDADLPEIDDLIEAWMTTNTLPVIAFDTTEDDPDYSSTLGPLLAQLDLFFTMASPR